MLIVGDEPGSAVPAVTASTKSTPESRSKVANSPVCALMATTIIGLAGHSWRGNRAATTARCCPAVGPSMESHSNPNAPIARCRSAAEVAAAEMALIRSKTVAIGRAGGRSRFCPTGRNGRGQHRGEQFGRRYAAAHLCCCGGTRRRADHQIGGLCHIETRFGQACDDPDLPGISGGPTTTENQSNVVSHLRVRRTVAPSQALRIGLYPRSTGAILETATWLGPFQGIRDTGTRGPTTAKLWRLQREGASTRL